MACTILPATALHVFFLSPTNHKPRVTPISGLLAEWLGRPPLSAGVRTAVTGVGSSKVSAELVLPGMESSKTVKVAWGGCLLEQGFLKQASWSQHGPWRRWSLQLETSLQATVENPKQQDQEKDSSLTTPRSSHADMGVCQRKPSSYLRHCWSYLLIWSIKM